MAPLFSVYNVEKSDVTSRYKSSMLPEVSKSCKTRQGADLLIILVLQINTTILLLSSWSPSLMHFLDILHTNAVVVWLVPEQAHFVTEATTVTLHTLEFQFFPSLIICAISGIDKHSSVSYQFTLKTLLQEWPIWLIMINPVSSWLILFDIVQSCSILFDPV